MRCLAVLVSVAALGACGDNVKGRAVVGGHVSGLDGTGLVLRNGTETIDVHGDGTFAFPTSSEVGATYAVTVDVQPTSPTQTCTVLNGSGTIASDEPIDNITVTCQTGVFTVGGTVTGLSGTGLVLQNNGADDLALDANGMFTFATPVASGASFAVTVNTQPSGLTQTCSVAGAAGTVGNGPVTTVVVDCSTDRFTVGGLVAGLEGTVVLQDNAGDDITVSSNGSFAFPTTIASGGAYAVTVLTQPGTPSQTCTVTSGSGTVTDADITSVRVDCVTNTFAVGGTVTGLAGAGLVLQNNAGDNVSVDADGMFTFPTPVASAETYTVTVLAQPAGPTQVCTVTNGTGTIGGADVSNVAVNCVTSTFTIGGTVTGLTGTGLVLRDNGGNDLPIGSNGTFELTAPVASGEMFSVTVSTQPSGPTQTCVVTGGTGTVGAGAVTSVAVNCSTNTYSIGGTITGLVGTVVLRNSGGNDLPVSANGTFAFSGPIASGETYDVTVATQPSGPSQTCTVTAGSGTVVASAITSVNVTCVTRQFPVRATVSGLAGSGLVLQNNSGDDLSITGNGTFTFSTQIDSGATYNVTVLTNPSSLSQTCSVARASGVVGDGPVTDIAVTCVTNTYTVGGTVTGLVGTGLVLRDNGTGSYPISANGTFALPALSSGSAYAVTVADDPTTPWQTCTVSSGTGTVTNANITSVAITCTTNTYTVGGTVTGLSGSGLVLQNNGGDNLTITGNGTFELTTQIASGHTFDVTVLTQPSGPTQTCTVAGGSGTVGGDDVTTVTVNCTTNEYTVGGTITGLAGAVVLQNNGADDRELTANGTFSFSTTVPSGGTYAITVAVQPGTPAQTCTVASGSGTVTNANITSVAITCTTNTYTVNGTLSGLAAGDSIVLRNNGTNDRTLTANGAFSFTTAVASGQPYAVTVVANPSSPIAQTCTVTNGSGTVGAANVTNVTVTCTTTTYTVGGTISGLTGSVVLRDNGGDALTVSSNGTFTFATPVASGAAYAVTVGTQPAGQLCTVTNGSGTVGAANVTTPTVSCVTAGCGRFDGTTAATWETRATLPNQTYAPGWSDYSAIGGSSFYSLAGSSLLRYDGSTNAWTTVASPTNFVGHWPSPAWVGDYLYSLASGYVQRYSVASNSWSVMLSGVATANYGQSTHDDAGNVYSWASDGGLLKYSVADNTVTHLTTGLSSINEPRLVWDSCTQKLYLAPSYAANNWYSFDPATSTLTTLPSHPDFQVNDIVCSDRSGHIYAAGAYFDTTMWKYDTATKVWSQLPTTPFADGNSGACTVSDDGYLYFTPGAGGTVARLKLN